jgi:tetratricopeptide (TPR) repeat protein
MTLTHPARLAAAAALAFGVGLLVSVLLLHGADPPGVLAPRAPAGILDGAVRPVAGTDAEIARLQAALRAQPANAERATALADAYLQKVRETGDVGYYTRADGLLRQAAARSPRDPGVPISSGTLALARHDFAGGLALARRARRLAPDSRAADPVLVDALVELGRYGAAEHALQSMVDHKPNLSAYARVSYFRELHGELDGAVSAMRLAIAAGGAVPENVAYVQSLLGHLELARGHEAAARQAFEAALRGVPGYVPALVGLARLDATRGDLEGAIRRWRPIVERLPLPEYVIGLGEAELAAGRAADGRRDLALVGAERRLLAAAGVNTDVELALFEADHGDRARAVALARRAWAAAPSVRSADALGWALTRAGRPAAGLRWSQRALRLGSLDPGLRFHAGMSALATGRRGEGRAQLRVALAHGLAGYPWQAATARHALGEAPS